MLLVVECVGDEMPLGFNVRKAAQVVAFLVNEQGGSADMIKTVKLAYMSAIARRRATERLKARANQRATDVGFAIRKLQAAGHVSLRDIAAGLNNQAIPTNEH